jgi:hypothetical protein
VLEINEQDREAAHLLAGPTIKRVHDIGHLAIPLAIRRQSLHEIHEACHAELDDSETDED